MKKLILSAAVLAIVASCSTNEVTDVAPSMQSAIGFSTLNDRVTKAANDVSADYKVYAVNSGSTSAFYIDDYVVTTEGVDAVQAGPYYWPTDGSTLDFYAYAPKASTSVTDSSANGVVALSYTVGTDAQEDFTAAFLSEYDSESASGYADFTFSHLLSKVTVNVVLEATFDVNHDLDADSYTFDLLLAENSLSIAGSTVSYGTSATTVEVAYTSAANGGYYNVLPQTMIDGCTISLDDITVTHTKSGVKVFNDVSLTPIPLYSVAGFTAFAPGTSYVFTITVGADATPDDGEDKLTVISFSSEATGWGDGTASLKQE